jgi:hypothetical protein
VGKLGYYMPWSIASGTLVAIGAGLLSSMNENTSIGMWVGYQILVGFGRGCGLQMPVVAISNHLTQAQIPIGMSLIAFGQSFGGTIFLAAAQTAFSAGLKSGLREYAPEIAPNLVAKVGATGFRTMLPAGSVKGVIDAYNAGLHYVFYVCAGCAAAMFCTAWGMGWKSVKKAKVVKPEA